MFFNRPIYGFEKKMRKLMLKLKVLLLYLYIVLALKIGLKNLKKSRDLNFPLDK